MTAVFDSIGLGNALLHGATSHELQAFPGGPSFAPSSGVPNPLGIATGQGVPGYPASANWNALPEPQKAVYERPQFSYENAVPAVSILGEGIDGLGTGLKSTSNGLVKAAKSAATLGSYDEYDGIFNYTEKDIARGALLSEGIANASGSILIGTATGRLASIAMLQNFCGKL